MNQKKYNINNNIFSIKFISKPSNLIKIIILYYISKCIIQKEIYLIMN